MLIGEKLHWIGSNWSHLPFLDSDATEQGGGHVVSRLGSTEHTKGVRRRAVTGVRGKRAVRRTGGYPEVHFEKYCLEGSHV